MLESKLMEHLSQKQVEREVKVVARAWSEDSLLIPKELESISKEDWTVVSIVLESLLDEREDASLH